MLSVPVCPRLTPMTSTTSHPLTRTLMMAQLKRVKRMSEKLSVLVNKNARCDLSHRSHGSSRSCFAVLRSSGDHLNMPLKNRMKRSFSSPASLVSRVSSEARSTGASSSAIQAPALSRSAPRTTPTAPKVELTMCVEALRRRLAALEEFPRARSSHDDHKR